MSRTIDLVEFCTNVLSVAVMRQHVVTTIGIDGPDCSGKSTLSRRLEQELQQRHYEVALVHGDEHLYSPAQRTRLGDFSLEGFMLDFFDRKSILHTIKHKKHLPGVDVVIVEGMFLFAEDLRHEFDHKIRLELNESEVLSRALQRDTGVLGTRSWVENHYRLQCIPAQRIYRHLVSPGKWCDWQVDTSGEEERVTLIKVPQHGRPDGTKV